MTWYKVQIVYLTQAFNLGTGTGYSVLEAVKTMENISGKKIAYKFAPRRPGKDFLIISLLFK